MEILSIKLTPSLSKIIDDLMVDGVGTSKADVVRKAIKHFVEDLAVEEILQAEKEPALYGDLDELIKQV